MTAGTEPTCRPLPLPFETPAAWAKLQVGHVATLLVDQAHLEKKAAAAAVSFLFRVPGGAGVQRALSALAREELVHFERTLRLLEGRGVVFAPLSPSAYAERLKAAIRRTMPHRLADELLVAAIIEARSCERMAAMARALRSIDDEVAGFYTDLCAAEERHQSLYVELAAPLLTAAELTQRWSELGDHEQRILGELPWSNRLHSGVGGVS